jgi:ATP-dependent Lhr-like helicase
MEARGEVRGGRFVASVSGEQFALPDAVALLRETRKAPLSNAFVSVSAADPLNLVGTVLPGPKVAALAANRVLLRDGIAVAALVAGNVQWLATLDPRDARAAEDALVRHQPGSPLLAYLR